MSINFTLACLSLVRCSPSKFQGPLRAGIFEVEGHVSSQFLTGLIFALSSLKENSTIVITTPLESIDYVYLTIDVLKHFGVDIVFKNQMITIKGGQTFNPVMTRIEGDYSQSAFLLIAGVLGGYVELKETSIDSLQGDKRIINILQSMGARLEIDNHHIKAFESKTFGTHIDLTHTPDLGPVLMILAALSQGNSTFTGLERLKYKESDRLVVMIDILQQFDVKYHLEEGTLTIEGRSDFAGGYTFDTYNDHRIAMALAVAAIKCRQPIMIKNPHVVSKSYPDFLKITLKSEVIMKQLFNMRQEIDIIDEQIRTLLIKRMEIVLAIGEYKKQHQLPILNEKEKWKLLITLNKI